MTKAERPYESSYEFKGEMKEFKRVVIQKLDHLEGQVEQTKEALVRYERRVLFLILSAMITILITYILNI